MYHIQEIYPFHTGIDWKMRSWAPSTRKHLYWSRFCFQCFISKVSISPVRMLCKHFVALRRFEQILFTYLNKLFVVLNNFWQVNDFLSWTTDFRRDWPSLMAHSAASVLPVLLCLCTLFSAMILIRLNLRWKKPLKVSCISEILLLLTICSHRKHCKLTVSFCNTRLH